MREAKPAFEPNILVARTDASRLLDRIARGDRDAFEAFYASHGARVMAMVRRQVAMRRLAEELVQDVFVAVWLGARGYREEMGDPQHWLLGITRHKLQDHWRRLRGLVRTVEAQAQAEQMRLDPRTSDADLRLSVEEALAGLPSEQRRALDLIYQCGLTFAETARALGVPAGTVKSRVHTALLTLRGFFRRSELP